MMHKILCVVGLMLGSALAQAGGTTFRVLERDTLNVMTVESETAVENFTGRTSKITGTIVYNPTTRSGSGSLSVNGASITTGMAARDGHMRGAAWLNFDKTPEVRFVATGVKALASAGQYEVVGDLTLNGVTKRITAPATLRLTRAGAQTEAIGTNSDVVALSTRFNIKLSEFRVQNRSIGRQVSDELTVTLRVVAAAQ